jgi:hypothetical protein
MDVYIDKARADYLSRSVDGFLPRQLLAHLPDFGNLALFDQYIPNAVNFVERVYDTPAFDQQSVSVYLMAHGIPVCSIGYCAA